MSAASFQHWGKSRLEQILVDPSGLEDGVPVQGVDADLNFSAN
jgi:hypothetical protein